MPSFTQLATVAAIFGSLVAAMPLESRGVKTFSFKQEPGAKIVRNGPTALKSIYDKYKKSVPKDVAAAAANDGEGINNPTASDTQYLTPVNIGGQTLNLDFDTGSSDLWVFSTELSSADQAGHNLYDPSKSSTSKALNGETWSITYGDGSSSSGNVYTDTVSVGTTSVPGQAVELAQTVSAQFQQDTASDGLLGLAFSSINTVKPDQQLTFFDNAKSTLSAPLFTAVLKHQAPGSYDFGYIDNSKYTGSIAYTPVDSSQGFWAFNVDSYTVGSGSSTPVSIAPIADTGTTLLLVDDPVVTAYYSGVPNAAYDSTQGGYTFPCSSSLPDITFGIGGYGATVSGSLVNFAPIDASGQTCFGGIQSNTGIGLSIFGDIFLKSQFVVFDSNGPQLGFAPQA